MLRIFITVPFRNLKIKSIFSNIFKTHFIYCTILWVFTQFPHIALMFSLRLINFLGCCPYEWSYFCNYLNILLYLNWFMLVYWNAVDSDTFLIHSFMFTDAILFTFASSSYSLESSTLFIATSSCGFSVWKNPVALQH